MRSAATLALLLCLLPACPGAEDEPREVVAGFLDALDAGDWDGVTGRLSTEALALLPEDEGARIQMKHQILETARGRIDYEILESSETDEGQARVVTKLSMLFKAVSLTAPITRTVTFGLTREGDDWKLLPAVTLPSGQVVENPLVILTLAGPDLLRRARGEDRPGAGD